MSISDMKLESALDKGIMQERLIVVLKEKIAFLEAQTQDMWHWKAEADAWRTIARKNRVTIESLRKELNEMTDAYNDLWRDVEPYV